MVWCEDVIFLRKVGFLEELILTPLRVPLSYDITTTPNYILYYIVIGVVGSTHPLLGGVCTTTTPTYISRGNPHPPKGVWITPYLYKLNYTHTQEK